MNEPLHVRAGYSTTRIKGQPFLVRYLFDIDECPSHCHIIPGGTAFIEHERITTKDANVAGVPVSTEKSCLASRQFWEAG